MSHRLAYSSGSSSPEAPSSQMTSACIRLTKTTQYSFRMPWKTKVPPLHLPLSPYYPSIQKMSMTSNHSLGSLPIKEASIWFCSTRCQPGHRLSHSQVVHPEWHQLLYVEGSVSTCAPPSSLSPHNPLLLFIGLLEWLREHLCLLVYYKSQIKWCRPWGCRKLYFCPLQVWHPGTAISLGLSRSPKLCPLECFMEASMIGLMQ